jgi:hypothetical protein
VNRWRENIGALRHLMSPAGFVQRIRSGVLESARAIRGISAHTRQKVAESQSHNALICVVLRQRKATTFGQWNVLCSSALILKHGY